MLPASHSDMAQVQCGLEREVFPNDPALVMVSIRCASSLALDKGASRLASAKPRSVTALQPLPLSLPKATAATAFKLML